MSIKTKIFALVFAFSLLSGVIAALGLKTMADYRGIITEYRTASQNAFQGERLNRLVLDVAVQTRGLYLSSSDAEARDQGVAVDASVDRLAVFLTAWKAQLKPGELPAFEPVGADLQEIIRGVHQTAFLARTVSLQAALGYGHHGAYSRRREIMQAKIDALTNGIEAHLHNTQETLARFEAARIWAFLLIAAGGIFILSIGSLWLAFGSVAAPLRRVSQAIVRISEGAYDTPVPSTRKDDEIGQIWGAIAILKDRAQEADRLTCEKLDQAREQIDEEHRLRELVLD